MHTVLVENAARWRRLLNNFNFIVAVICLAQQPIE